MTPEQVKENLEAFGLRLDHASRSKACVEAFCVEMQNRQYGVDETADAFMWFERGWQRAKARL